MPGIDDDARDELCLSLQVVHRWQLSDEGWRLVERLLIAVRDDVLKDDRVSFFRHLAESLLTEPRPRASHGWRPTSRRPRPARQSPSSS